jgi:branched-chain amino acid transport system substrate-binding protein
VKRVVALTVLVTLLVVAALAGAWKAFSGDGDDAKPELKGTVTFAVLAPSERTGEIGARGKDLLDGARMAAAEVNDSGGVLGHKVVLQTVDDACDPQVAYEAAKDVASDGSFAGALGGMCNGAAAREVAPVDASGVPFLVTTADDPKLVQDDLQSTYFMNGTLHQQALSALYWMNYREAQRLAIVGEQTPRSKALTKDVISLIDQAPKLVSLQELPEGQTDMATVAKAALASKPDFVYWTGSAASGGVLVKELLGRGFKKTFTASADSESQAFLDAAGPGGAEGAFVTATSSGTNTPTASKWRARFKETYGREPGLDALQAYDSVRTLAQAVKQAKATDGEKVAANVEKLSLNFVNFLGVVRFAADHTLLYDNRVILVVKDDEFTWERSLRTDSLQ